MMARRGRQCVVEGCWRRARAGQLVCVDHRGTGVAMELGREVAKLEREVRALLRATNPEEQRDAGRRFRRKVERGEFAALFAGKMQALFEGREGEEPLRDEIGALRVAMMRLLLEEDDAAVLAKGLSQVTNATVRALRAQQGLAEEGVTAGMLARSVAALEERSRGMTEEEVFEAERRAWKREVGWTAADEAAWFAPEHQRRLLEEGIDEATARVQRRARIAGGEAVAPGSSSDRALTPGNLTPSSLPAETGVSADVVVTPDEALTPGRSPNSERGETAEEGAGRPVVRDSLEAAFWEDDDPWAYRRELDRLSEGVGE